MRLRINDRIKVRTIEFFNEFSLNLKYDAVASSFAFKFYFDPTNNDHKELACVSHFHEASVDHNGQTLITGYILAEVFNTSSKKELVQFAGYSKPGVLEDCEIPPSLYPLQSDGLSLREIAKKYLTGFKLNMVIDPLVSARMDIPYTTTTAKESQTIKSYLTELASQRNIIISHDVFGNLLFTQTKANQKPLFHVENGLIATAMSLAFNGQALHSEITVIKQADSDGGNAGEFTVKNPFVPIVYRPKVIVQSSGDDIATEDAAKNALAAELKNIVLTITTDRWEVDNKMIVPNSVISVLAPELYIYKKSNWFIESVNYSGDETKQVATLTCVLPECYNGETPVNIFVNPH